MDKIAVLIPCYNEQQTIAKVVRDFRAELPEAKIYVYDNNSTDGSDRLAREAGAIVRYERKQGKGNVIRRMFAEVDAECYLMVDGDDTYSPKNARELVNCVLEKDSDMAVGDRLSSSYFTENKRPFHNFGNKFVRWSINKLFSNDNKDIMTGYRAFSYRFVKTFPIMSRGFEIETEMSIHAAWNNLMVDNVVIDYRDRPEGSESKLSTYSDGFRVIRMVHKMFRTYRPAFYYGIVAMILFLLSLIFVIPVFISYAKTGLVSRFPTLIVCGFTVLAAIEAFFAGQILRSIQERNRQKFELDLYRATRELRRARAKSRRRQSL